MNYYIYSIKKDFYSFSYRTTLKVLFGVYLLFLTYISTFLIVFPNGKSKVDSLVLILALESLISTWFDLYLNTSSVYSKSFDISPVLSSIYSAVISTFSDYYSESYL